MAINFVKDFQQDPNSTIDHKDRSDFSFLQHKHFATDLHHSYYECEESKLPYSDRQGNDDYFPQGEEYEEEIGTDDYHLGKTTPNKKPSRLDDEFDNFESMMLMFENNKCINGDPLTRFITRVHFSSVEELTETDQIMSKKISNKDAVEKLQALIEKVTEFKRRVFHPKHDAPKTEVTTDGKKEKKIANENKNNEAINRSCFISQKISMSAY